MNFDLKEIERALAYIKSTMSGGVINISFDPMQRMLIKYTDPAGEDSVTITIFPSEREKMAEVTRTCRL